MIPGLGFWSPTPVGPALVRKAAATASGGTSVGLSLDGVAAGSKLLLFVAAWQEGAATSDPSTVSGGGSWAKRASGGFADTSFTTGGALSGQQTSLWSADASAGGTVSVSVAFAVATYAQIVLAEFAGVAAGAAAFDRSASAASQAAVNQNPAVGPTAATTQDAELVVALLGISGISPNAGIDAATSGFTNLGVGQDTSTVCAYSFDFKAVAAAGQQSAAWGTIGSDAGYCSALIATFKAA